VQEWSTLVVPVNLKVAVGFGAMILVLILRPEGIFARPRSAGR
jgi:branched-subunit amino acid ABC-type transport system permease component